jgi:hypothetical protein
MKLTSQTPSSTSLILSLTGHDGGDVDLAVHADAAAGGDQNVLVVEGIVQLCQAVVGL